MSGLYGDIVISSKLLPQSKPQTFPSTFCAVICMFPWISSFWRAAQNEREDNIQIYVHIISECSVQVTSRCNTSEAPSWRCHDVNWSLMECLRGLLLARYSQLWYAAESFCWTISAERNQGFKLLHAKAFWCGWLFSLLYLSKHRVSGLDGCLEWQVALQTQQGKQSLESGVAPRYTHRWMKQIFNGLSSFVW